ncbi:radical SAM protein [Bacillaceae bacterium S4-13-56]
MLKDITLDTIHMIKNRSFSQYAQIYTNIEQSTLEQIETFGVPLQKRVSKYEKDRRLEELRKKGATVRNQNKSVVTNRISSACEACQTGVGSYTTYPSLKCHRKCYFCFNPNQDDYQIHVNQQKDINEELTRLLDRGITLRHLALTGGEPLLFKKETIEFFELANQLTPDTHTRLYTTGDLLDIETLEQLKTANLNEIRFSIKMEDSLQKISHILSQIKLAKNYIPDVLVEMPVIPGTVEEMKKLLLELEKLEIFGINLLEFCFPLGNANAFTERGFELKNPPYEMYYNYWYAGGLAVADSEKECLDLVDFALENELKLGVHYCSLVNKYTGQIYQQNVNETLDSTYLFSNRDYYFKTAKGFGKDRDRIKPTLIKKKIPFEENDEYSFIQFSVEAIPYLRNKNVEIAISSNVVEEDRGESFIREVGLSWTKPDLFHIEDILEKKTRGEFNYDIANANGRF